MSIRSGRQAMAGELTAGGRGLAAVDVCIGCEQAQWESVRESNLRPMTTTLM